MRRNYRTGRRMRKRKGRTFDERYRGPQRRLPSVGKAKEVMKKPRRFRRGLFELPDARASERQWWWRTPVAAGQLRLIGDAAMIHAIGISRVRLLAAEMEIRLAGMSHGPA